MVNHMLVGLDSGVVPCKLILASIGLSRALDYPDAMHYIFVTLSFDLTAV